MNVKVTYLDHALDIVFTPAATKALEKKRSALYIDLRLYFGCMPRKEISFEDSFEPKAKYKINSKLFIRYQSLMTNSCQVGGTSNSEYQLTPKQIGQPVALKVDYKNDEWLGEYQLKNDRESIETSAQLSPAH